MIFTYTFPEDKENATQITMSNVNPASGKEEDIFFVTVLNASGVKLISRITYNDLNKTLASTYALKK